MMEFVCGQKKQFSSKISEQQHKAIESMVIQCLRQTSINSLQLNINGLSFLVEMLKKGLQGQFQALIKELVEQPKNQGLLSLVEDEEELEYFESRLRGQH
jgi:hypothetical protein